MLEGFDFSKSAIGLFFYFLKQNRIKLTILGLLCIIRGMIPAVDSVLLQKIINLIESFSDETVKDLPSSMLFWAIIYAFWWVCVNTMWRIYDYIYLKTMPYIKAQILDKMYNYTQYHNHRFFQENLAGHITNRITEGARSFEIVLSLFGEKILYKLAIIVFALGTMYWVHQIFATIFLIHICVFVGTSVICSSTINKYSVNYARSKSIVAGSIVDAIANIGAIRMFTSHKFERQNLEVRIDDAVVNEQIMQLFMFKLRIVLGIACSIMICIMVYYLAQLRSQMQITIGDCVLILTLSITVSSEIWDLTQEVGDMFEEFGSFNQSVSLMKPHIIEDIENAHLLKVTTGEIIFKNVSFKYYHNNNLFENKSVTIFSQQKVGLVGFSGSGKTTFINLITRLHDIDQGEILIDGQNIRYVTQDSLRENISIIPQEPILFHRTVMDNIRYGKKDASLEEVIEAAKLAHIHEFIEGLPEGYQSLCGERGNNLSGGQRQRIIIARAILKNASILILDEATSSLDSETEELIQDSLYYLMQNKTVLAIAHRLSTLLNMDRILVFNEGSIVEDGQHEELLKNSKLYKKLWKSQVKGLII
ncbi:ABC transporter ATP-binding protein [Candidatus Tisiphia endosymbiont of Micropterix aruncella]|uniref:ABC transporter ATP-binding protein n=1 Tax=Candidatus Tisiphia endosymbiont of Micropterix aruncella TaxID=3066271 RepID=UPI003AA877B6